MYYVIFLWISQIIFICATAFVEVEVLELPLVCLGSVKMIMGFFTQPSCSAVGTGCRQVCVDNSGRPDIVTGR